MDKTEIIKGLKIATNKIGGCSDVGGWLSDDEAKAVKACNEVIKGLEENTIILCEEMQTMKFPNTFEEFVQQYGFRDSDRVYTNGIVLIPAFRVEQLFNHISELKGENNEG